jgi:hypothetical protein
MQKNRLQIFVMIVAFAVAPILLPLRIAVAGWTNENSASQTVNFKVMMPLVLDATLPNAIITFDLTNSAIITPAQLGDNQTRVPADVPFTIEVKVNSKTATITATLPPNGELLNYNQTEKIPFNREIIAYDGGIIKVPSFQDYPANPTPTSYITSKKGNLKLIDQWRFVFQNTQLYAPGIYYGTVVYTTSVP